MARLVRSLGSHVTEAVDAAGVAISEDRDLLSQWITFQLPSGEFSFIDSEGPILRALAMTLMTGSGLRELVAPWMTAEKAQTLKTALREVSSSEPDLQMLNMTQQVATTAADRIDRLIDAALADNRTHDDTQLIGQTLDQTKVDTFGSAVLEGWSDVRLLPDLLRLTNTSATGLPIGEWGDTRFGLRQHLPKGLFVTPSNWAGLDHLGRNVGESIAYGEVEAIVTVLAEMAPIQSGQGNTSELLDDAINSLVEEGYDPSVIFLPPNYELITELGLPPWQPPNPAHGNLGVHIKGLIRGIPAVEWRRPPRDVLIVADLSAAVQITLGVNDAGETLPPTTIISVIDDDLARDIIARDPDRDEPAEDRLTQLLTSVDSFSRLPYRIAPADQKAVRLIERAGSSPFGV